MRRVGALRVVSWSNILALLFLFALLIFWLTLRRVGTVYVIRVHLTEVFIPASRVFGCAIVRVACLEVGRVLLTIDFIPAVLIVICTPSCFSDALCLFRVSLAPKCIPALHIVFCAGRHFLFDVLMMVFNLHFEEFAPWFA